MRVRAHSEPGSKCAGKGQVAAGAADLVGMEDARIGSMSGVRWLPGAGNLVACVVALVIWGSIASCMVAADDTRAQAAVAGQQGDLPASYRTFVPSLPVSHPPYSEFHASWMQRLDQPYIYLEHYGSYAETGSILPVVIREMRIQGLEPSGAPFCLFYDDPAQKPADQLLSRACVPIADQRSPVTPLRYEVLPSRTVAYAYVSGAYPEVPRSYPYILDYMKGRNFVIDGPIRETYIVPPSVAKAASDFLCEVQVPVASGNR